MASYVTFLSIFSFVRVLLAGLQCTQTIKCLVSMLYLAATNILIFSYKLSNHQVIKSEKWKWELEWIDLTTKVFPRCILCYYVRNNLIYFDQILVIHTPLEKTINAGVLEKILDLSPHFGSFLIRYTDGVKVISMIFDDSLTPYQIEMNTKL